MLAGLSLGLQMLLSSAVVAATAPNLGALQQAGLDHAKNAKNAEDLADTVHARAEYDLAVSAYDMLFEELPERLEDREIRRVWLVRAMKAHKGAARMRPGEREPITRRKALLEAYSAALRQAYPTEYYALDGWQEASGELEQVVGEFAELDAAAAERDGDRERALERYAFAVAAYAKALPLMPADDAHREQRAGLTQRLTAVGGHVQRLQAPRTSKPDSDMTAAVSTPAPNKEGPVLPRGSNPPVGRAVAPRVVLASSAVVLGAAIATVIGMNVARKQSEANIDTANADHDMDAYNAARVRHTGVEGAAVAMLVIIPAAAIGVGVSTWWTVRSNARTKQRVQAQPRATWIPGGAVAGAFVRF